MKDNVKKFVEAYNTLTKFINEQTVVTKVGEDKNPVTGALLGDASVRALVNTMRSELIASNENGSVRNLAALGITTTKDGTLEIDEEARQGDQRRLRRRCQLLHRRYRPGQAPGR